MYVLRACPVRASVRSTIPIIRSTACTAWVRLRNHLFSCLILKRPSGGCPSSQDGGFVLAVLNAGDRAAITPRKSRRSRGAGVYGACGAKVASSSMNGWPAAADRRMNATPFFAMTSVR